MDGPDSDPASQDKLERLTAVIEDFQKTVDSIDPDLFSPKVPDDPGPPISPEDIDRICDGYFHYHEWIARGYIRLAPRELSDISDEVMEMLNRNPERLWPLLLALIERAPTEEIRGFVAAGPLEDLVRWYPERFIDRVEAEAVRSENFHEALRGIWGREGLPDQIRERLIAVVTPEWEQLDERRAELG